ncbi:hypothetical protein [Paenibacillus sp. RC67]|uniref:hypothetical protein n=1 Tax=Paenibacillus sp. RC67 TaxID=3039392 RepID=UPI0024AC8AE2|nr:hypothetical protein [Paenibacillus sp. RC67]
MRDAKVNGFEVTMFYVGLGDYNLNLERVAVRVKNGGHHIPSEDIIRRHQTSIQNLISHLELIDHLIVIDNSLSEGRITLGADDGSITCRSETVPSWIECIVQK